MAPKENPGRRPHRSRLAALSAFGVMAGSLAFALLPVAAFANTGSVSATEDCQTWSAQVVLANNVSPNHLIDVIVSPSFGHPGFTGGSYDTHGGSVTIWGPFTGSAPLTGTVTLVIHNPVGNPHPIEHTYTKTIHPPDACHAPSITTSLSAGSITVPGAVHDSATLSGATADAGGSVTYTVYTDTACSQGARSAGTKTVSNGSVPVSDGLVFDSVGTVYWQAGYSGDVHNLRAQSACSDEPLVVTKAADAVVTQATPATGVVGKNGTVGDTATISSAFQPSGSVSFNLYSDPGCASAVNGVGGSGAIGNGAASFSTSWTPPAAGTYYWKVSYAGDANNNGFTECGGANEVITVTDAPAGGTQGTVTPPPAGGVQSAATTAPGLPKAGHPAVELAPAANDLVRAVAVAFLLLGIFVVLVARVIFSDAGNDQG